MTVTTARTTTGVKAEEGDLVVLRKERTISTHNNRKQRWEHHQIFTSIEQIQEYNIFGNQSVSII